jgi:hypothetical protein
MIKEVCSPLNARRLSKPAPNAPSLKTANPKSAAPNVRGKQAPTSSPSIPLPVGSTTPESGSRP